MVVLLAGRAHGLPEMTAAATASKRVLLIVSYHPTFPPFSQQISGLREGLEERGLGDDEVLIDAEFMDSKRHFTAENLNHFRETLTYKLAHSLPYHVVVTADDNALDFALEHRDGLLAGLPIVFLGVNNVANAMSLNADHRVTGVVEAASMVDTLRLIPRLKPGNRRVVAVADPTITSHRLLKAFREAVPQIEGLEGEVLSLTDLTFEELAAELKRLPPETSLMFISAFRDKTGRTMSLRESLAYIRENARGPVYSLWDSGLGQGVLGGRVISQLEQGRAAGRIVADILAGRSPAQIPVLADSPNVYTFDHRALKRFGIDEGLLPEGSVVLNRPQTFWALHSKLAVGSLSVFLAMSAAIAFLIKLTRKLRALERYNRLLLTSTAEAIYGLDLEGKCTFCNPATVRLLGYDSAEELIGRSMHALIHYKRADGSPYPKEECQIYEACRFGGSVHVSDEVIWRKDGTSFPAEYWSHPIRRSGRIVGAVVSLLDITERKRAERLDQQLGRILNSAFSEIYMFDAETYRFTQVNHGALSNLGYTMEELARMKSWDLKPGFDEESFGAAVEPLRRRELEMLIFETEHRRRDGSHYPVEVRLQLSHTESPPVFLAIVADITDRKQVEERIRKVNAQLEQRVEARTAELRSAQEELLRKSRLAALGQLTGTVSHELRNPLGALRTSIATIRKLTPDATPVMQQSIEIANRSVTRCDEIITDLLEYSRTRPLNCSAVNLDTWLSGVLNEVEVPAGIALTRTLNCGLELPIDPDRMRRAVINVVDNACQAMIAEEDWPRRANEEAARTRFGQISVTSWASDERVELRIADSGAGMDETTRAKIFEPLYSTKSFGVGLGLTVVKQIMEQHGGGVEIASAPGEGAEVVLWLPLPAPARKAAS